MIELNLTYEESKRILELGYDFSKICWFFRKETPSFKMNLIKIDNDFLTYATPEGENFGDHIDCVYSSVKETMQAGYTPIIPKAVLEECLPDKLDVASLNNYVIVKNCVFVKNIDLKTISLSYFFEDYHSCYAEQIEFNSTFEAFLWCHEKYPEELRKKFKEVMG